MTELITAVFGKYAFEGVSLLFTFLECQLCISLLCGKRARRPDYAIRILIAVIAGAVACYLLAIWNTESRTILTRVLCYLLISVLNFLFLIFCWKDSLSEMFVTFCSGMAIYQIGNKFFPLLQNLCGINDRETLSLFHRTNEQIEPWEWILFYGARLAVYAVLILCFRPKNRRLASDARTRSNTVLLLIATILIVDVLVCIARVYEFESLALSAVVKVFTILFGFVVLLAGSGIFSVSEREQQINILNQLMKQEKMQFDSVKANMDAINMKCHDLKHIIDKIENKLTESETDSLREAIRFYDANIKTGNEVMDVVLCEKAVLCEKNGITFSCMADGDKFRFLTAVQTYSLFGNIIDNAIEAIGRLTDPEKKVISLVCSAQNGCPVIEESNYFEGELKLTDGLPSTVKEDSARHGFGTKSIRYIAEQYGGTMEIKAIDGMFFLQVRFPPQTI